MSKLEELIGKPIAIGARVRAKGPIYYAISPIEVDEGDLGTAVRVSHSGYLAHVRWDKAPADVGEFPTSADSLEAVDGEA